MILTLDIPPGVWRNGTDLQGAGRWRDANLVRWTQGALQPIGGWRAFGDSAMNAAPRGSHLWVTNSGDLWVATGTYNKLYVVSSGGDVSDVTPTGLTAGRESAEVNTGYGGGLYGRGTYGTPRAETGVFQPATTWTMDNWGQNLIACSPDDGEIYEWTLSTASAAAAVSNAPTGCKAIVVTEERFLFALGAGGDARKVQWCDRENNTSWTPSATNEAGDFTLQTNGSVIAGRRLRGQTLILTTTDAHVANFIGAPLVYGFEQVGQACGLVSPAGVAVLDGRAYWMSRESFFAYDGGSVQQLPCDVGDYVFANINRTQASKAHAVTNSHHGEVWWFFPSSASNEVDSYVVYDVLERTWTVGSLDRTSGVDGGVSRLPVWWASDGQGYQHEVQTFDYDGASPFAETGPINLGDGGTTFTVNELLPDELTQGDARVRFKTRNYPNAAETEHGPYTLTPPTSVRLTGRQVRMRVEGEESADWRVGVMRLRARQRGRR